MPSEACIGRVGGLAVALGVGVGIFSGWSNTPAWADDSPASAGKPSASEDSGLHASSKHDDAVRLRSRPEPSTDKPRHRNPADVVRRTGDDEDSPGKPSIRNASERRLAKPRRMATRAEQSPDAASTPRVVSVARRVVTDVASAALSPMTSIPTPAAPADSPSMSTVLAFARREFDSAVRPPGLRASPAAKRTTSETIADTAVEHEKRTLVLTAFPAEADAILARTTLDENPVVVADGRHYYLGTLGGKKVIVAMTGIGMENAADTTETALTRFTVESAVEIDAVVFAGVAGGSGRTQIGDVAVPAEWTSDDGATWHPVDSGMLAAAGALTVDLGSTDTIADPACRVCGPFSRLRLVDLNREPQVYVGGEGSSDDNNNGAAFPSIPLGGGVFGPQPLAAPDFSPLFTGNFFRAIGPFLVRAVVSNITGFLTATSPPVDAVDQETAAAQQVADAHGVPFLGIRGMSDGPGDPLNLPGYPFTFFVYKQIAADNAAIVTEAFLQNWDGS
jgi:nucleoside phosphorylase